ncbi:LLM class flavin-dependent oxidoreductase [Massilia antarctica]|uniref:LLM class flavin-dependent oxidoreductase n=1 Tax=Massilia antarctica TaxID=2765360 RepID=UPI0006BB6D42|nr:LLM class flavin-dependent oxidoreductase [Massilia sp. H27-R4]MCY0915160.1 LLM class flavin-dependent oxidoreductase [Massilia sp. H27-R4]CUI07142.1 Bacterial luciferase family protein [Janthinobacterium sp. CG23_2]CUU30928.1 Bacterial luciferase family protein [Janthinobacterium sp. CG23_2]
MIPFSVLDLSPITQGSSARVSFQNTLDLAQHAERWGYKRYWLAEHHGMPGIASAATAVLLGYVAGGTSTIRVGAGGVMLPNHSPLVIAEQFGTLESLYPGRIDLGLGRAPGSDQATARAMRRNLQSDADEFPQDVVELMDYFSDATRRPVMAVPGAGLKVPLWILGSSLFGAQLAAQLGLPYAFASHFAPAQMMQAVDLYRARFRPSAQLDKPYVMLGFNVFAADTDDQAALLATSMQQAFVNLRSGRPGRLQPPVSGYLDALGPQERTMLDQVLSCSAIGAPQTVARQLQQFIERTGADELMITSQIFDHQARLHSYEIVGQIHAAAHALA